jgi:hypothetical protein
MLEEKAREKAHEAASAFADNLAPATPEEVLQLTARGRAHLRVYEVVFARALEKARPRS